MVAPAGVMLQAESDEATIVAFKDRAVRISPEAVAAFAALSDCEAYRVTDLPPVGTEAADRRAEFARQLVTHGLAVVEPLPS